MVHVRARGVATFSKRWLFDERRVAVNLKRKGPVRGSPALAILQLARVRNSRQRDEHL